MINNYIYCICLFCTCNILYKLVNFYGQDMFHIFSVWVSQDKTYPTNASFDKLHVFNQNIVSQEPMLFSVYLNILRSSLKYWSIKFVEALPRVNEKTWGIWLTKIWQHQSTKARHHKNSVLLMNFTSRAKIAFSNKCLPILILYNAY